MKERANFYATNLYLNPEVYDEGKADAYRQGYIHGAEDTAKIIKSRIEYWFKNIGPFVFPEDDETLEDLMSYIDKDE